jgi:hypothetical protein
MDLREEYWTNNCNCFKIGRSIAEAVSRWLPTAAARVQSRVWSSGICGGVWRRDRFSPCTSVSPAIHSTKFSILTITRGRYNRPVSGLCAEWTQFGLQPPTMQIKKKNRFKMVTNGKPEFNRKSSVWVFIFSSCTFCIDLGFLKVLCVCQG